MQLHDILLLRTSAILPEAISAGGLTPPLIQACFSPPIEVGVISQLIYLMMKKIPPGYSCVEEYRMGFFIKLLIFW